LIGRISITAILLVLWSDGAKAQDHEVLFKSFHAEGCLSEATSYAEQEDCIGYSARICVEETSDTPLTVTQVLCAMEERDFWDRRLSTRYRHLQIAFQETDAELKIDNTTPFPKSIALLEMQAIWPSFRDQTCKFETALWGWGSTSGLEEVTCLMRVTAEQALYLERQPDGDF